MTIAELLLPEFDQEMASTVDTMTKTELLSWFDAGVPTARAALQKPDVDHIVPWTLKNGAQVFFTMPRYTCIRSFVLNHIVHHRAQLGVYLRLNNIPIPGVYGPSADES